MSISKDFFFIGKLNMYPVGLEPNQDLTVHLTTKEVPFEVKLIG